jgi:prophage antirepressor-like protein
MNALQLFNHEQFGRVRITDQNGEPWFVATDIAKALGYKKPNNAIKAHCKKACKISYPVTGQRLNKGLQDYNIIPESDLYRLVFKSELPDIEPFIDWVTEEVIPSIRKTGRYIITTDYPHRKGKKAIFFTQAEQMYVEDGLTMAAIAKVLPVATRTLSTWKKEGNWEDKRRTYLLVGNKQVSIASVCARVLSLVEHKLINGQQPTAEELQIVANLMPQKRQDKPKQAPKAITDGTGEVWLSTKQCGDLLGISSRQVQRQISEGKWEHKMEHGNGGLAYRILLSSLPLDIQVRYYKEI